MRQLTTTIYLRGLSDLPWTLHECRFDVVVTHSRINAPPRPDSRSET